MLGCQSCPDALVSRRQWVKVAVSGADSYPMRGDCNQLTGSGLKMAAKKTATKKKSQQKRAKSAARKKTTGAKKASKRSAGSGQAATKGSIKATEKGSVNDNELVYVASSPIHGKGLFARKKLKANVTLGNIEGRPTRRDGTYVLWLSETDGLRVTNDFRFINHSNMPNCALTGSKVVTLKTVKADEELTHDYGW